LFIHIKERSHFTPKVHYAVSTITYRPFQAQTEI